MQTQVQRLLTPQAGHHCSGRLPVAGTQRPLPGLTRQHALRVSAIASPPRPSRSTDTQRVTRTTTTSTPYASSIHPAPGHIFANIEQRIAATFSSNQPGMRGDWTEVDGCWVLRPPATAGPAKAVVHFIGAAFVGAAPQLTYRLFLETLANRGIMVITTPYATGFDHLRVADEAQFMFDACMHTLDDQVKDLPIYGVGHSMGALIHLLINARYSVEREGNVLLSFNNRPATDSVPFLSPFIAPGARALGPILARLAASPLRTSVEGATELLRGVSPGLLRQLLPVVEQLTPIYLDVAQGRQEFAPAPEETRNLVRSYYGVEKNLLLRFVHDKLDETNQLASMLQSSSAVSKLLDLSVRTLPGDALRPLRQAFGDLPPELARVANTAVAQGGEFITRISDMAVQAGFAQASEQLDDFAENVSEFAHVFGGNVGGPVVDNMQELADEIVDWMDLPELTVRTRTTTEYNAMHPARSHTTTQYNTVHPSRTLPPSPNGQWSQP